MVVRKVKETVGSIYIGAEKILGLENMTIIGHEENYVNGEPQLTIFTQTSLRRRPCPECDSLSSYAHGYVHRQLQDVPVGDHVTYLDVTVHRYKCQKCGKVFQDSLEPLVSDGANITNRMKERIARIGAVHGFSIAGVSTGISTSEAKRVFDEWSERMDVIKDRVIEAPEVLGIDEAHIGPRVKDMRGVFVDVKNGRLLEIAPDKKPETIQNMIMSMKGWQTNIKAVTIDMSIQYRSDIYTVFGAAPILIVADHFHVIQDLYKQVRKSRKLIVEAAGNPSLGNNFLLMRCNLEDLTEDQRVELYTQFKAVPELKTLYLLKESFRSIYSCSSRKEAEKRFDQWKLQIPSRLPDAALYDENGKVIKKRGRKKKSIDRFDPIRSYADTIETWRKEVFNWFELNVSNATTEAINRMLKEINRYGRGYSFDTFRHKVLYGLTNAYLPVEKAYVHLDENGKQSSLVFREEFYKDWDIEALEKNYCAAYVPRVYRPNDLAPTIAAVIEALETYGEEYAAEYEDEEAEKQ